MHYFYYLLLFNWLGFLELFSKVKFPFGNYWNWMCTGQPSASLHWTEEPLITKVSAIGPILSSVCLSVCL